MKCNISDLLDRYPAENLELDGRTPYSPSRIKEITMNNVNQTKSKDLKPNRTAKRFKPAQLLIAAAVVAALSVSALAAGRAFGAGELFQDFFATEGIPSPRASWTPLTGLDMPPVRPPPSSPPPSPKTAPPLPRWL